LTISAPQLGKTVVLGAWLLGCAWEGGPSATPWWWTAPTYAQVQDGLTKFTNLARSAGVLKSATLSSPPRVVLINGAQIEGRSWERPENLYGRTIRGGVVDEFGWLTDPAYAAISSRRAETGGPLRYAGNVGEIGGVAEQLWRRAEAKEPGFACRRWTWRDRAAAHACGCGEIPIGLGTSSRHAVGCRRADYVRFVEGEASRMPGALFRQLYEAEWVDWNTLPAYDFDRALHVAERWEYDKNLPIEIGCDFNRGPMAWVLGQHVNDRAWAFDEICIDGGATTAAAADELVLRLKALGCSRAKPIEIYGDASGKYGSTKSVHTDYQILEARLRQEFLHVSLNVPEANPPVSTRLNAVNALLRAADGTIRYGIHPRCMKLADDYARTALRAGTHELDKSNRARTHFTDADGYRLARLFPLEKPGQFAVSRPGRVGRDVAVEMAF
jgi:hypothetical protein